MSAAESFPSPEKIPETQPAPSGGPPEPPPRPPKITARGLLEPGDSERTVFLADYVIVKDLAELLGMKPFKVVADLLKLRQFKHADECIGFSTAAMIAEKYGYAATRIID
jgi:translation initiation factor IF-2